MSVNAVGPGSSQYLQALNNNQGPDAVQPHHRHGHHHHAKTEQAGQSSSADPLAQLLAVVDQQTAITQTATTTSAADQNSLFANAGQTPGSLVDVLA